MATIIADEITFINNIKKQISDIEYTIANYNTHIGPSGEIYINNLKHISSLKKMRQFLIDELHRGPIEIY